MTVCIAAICQLGPGNFLVVGASDRMLTVGDTTEYEPPQHKVYRLSPKGVLMPQAALMIAGDTSAQWVIGRQTQRQIEDTGVTDVADMASIYAQHFAAHRRKEAEARILAPLGLDLSSFLGKQASFSPSFLSDVTYQLQQHRLNAAAIVAGVDRWGAHIYSIHDPGTEVCQDREGFAAIGIGAEHALSLFMVRKYVPTWPLHEALLLVYVAKKRAQAAPGVGHATDMFFVAPTIRADVLNATAIEQIDRIAQDGAREFEKLNSQLNDRMRQYVENAIALAQQGQAGPQTSNPTPATEPERPE